MADPIQTPNVPPSSSSLAKSSETTSTSSLTHEASHPAPKSRKRTSEFSTDELALLFSSRPHALDLPASSRGAMECYLTATSFLLGDHYSLSDGYAYMGVKTMVSKLGVSRSTVEKIIRNLKTSGVVHVETGHESQTNRYYYQGSITEDLQASGQQYDLATMKTQIRPQDLITLHKHPSSRPLATEEEVAAAVDLSANEVAPLDAFNLIAKYRNMHVSPAEKVRAAGFQHSNQIRFLAGKLRYISLAAMGFSLAVAELYHFKSGRTTVPLSYWTSRGWSKAFVQRMHEELRASGVWSIHEGRTVSGKVQTVYVLTPFFHAVGEFWLTERAKTTPEGKPSGYRLQLTTVCPQLRGFWATRAERAGINDQLGAVLETCTDDDGKIEIVATTPAENPHLYLDEFGEGYTEADGPSVVLRTSSRPLKGKDTREPWQIEKDAQRELQRLVKSGPKVFAEEVHSSASPVDYGDGAL